MRKTGTGVKKGSQGNGAVSGYQEYKAALLRSTITLIFITSMLSVVIALLNFATPIMVSVFVNRYEEGTQVLPFLFALLGFYVVSYLIKLALNAIFQSYAVTFKTKQHRKLLAFMFKMKYDSLNKQEPTYLAERIAVSADTLYEVYAESVSGLVVAAISILMALFITARISLSLTALLVLLLLVQVFGYQRLNASLQNKCMTLQANVANNFKSILSVTSNVDYIKQEGNHEGILAILTPYVRATHRENARVNQYAKNISTSLSMLITVLQNLVYVGSAIMLAAGRITSAEFILVSMVCALYMSGLSEWVHVNINLRDIKGVNSFIENELMANMEEEGGADLQDIKEIAFRLRNVGYGEQILLEQGSFSVKRGDIVLLDGASGTGKSTLMKGLLKFLDIDSIFVNEIDVRKINTMGLRSRIQFFSQNVPVITGTIKENIAMGKNIADKDWEELSQKEFLKKFYELPKGLDTVVLENGSNLSGGDKQKLALARLYLENPDVIILDESTNSIDEETSMEIIKSVVRDFSDKIIFLISHNSQTREVCNRIVEIRNKKIAVQGKERHSAMPEEETVSCMPEGKTV